jgi:RING-H2 zinc finger domain
VDDEVVQPENFNITGENYAMNQESLCIICNSDMGRWRLVVGRCLHKFHQNCIRDWWRLANIAPTCPVCRQAAEDYSVIRMNWQPGVPVHTGAATAVPAAEHTDAEHTQAENAVAENAEAENAEAAAASAAASSAASASAGAENAEAANAEAVSAEAANAEAASGAASSEAAGSETGAANSSGESPGEPSAANEAGTASSSTAAVAKRIVRKSNPPVVPKSWS